MSTRQYAIFRGYLKTHSFENLQEGIRKYHEKHGKTPSVKSGNAEPYVGYKTTWNAVDCWLKYNGHGSLSQLCKELGFDPHYAPHSIKAIKVGIRKYHKEHGKAPSEKAGKATPYVGYSTTWECLSGWLKKHEGVSLRGLCRELKIETCGAPHSLKAIKSGVRKYHKEYGKTPSAIAGEAKPYIGYKATWAAVDQWLRKNELGSLSQLCKELGFDPLRLEHDLKAIKVGIRKYHKYHGKVPAKRYGDATPYVGYSTNWATVDCWLRNNGHRSLFQLCKKMSLKPNRSAA